MKYIVIGLGYFGAKLAANLTSMGHDVLGIDNHADRLDELKDTVSTVMKMDSTVVNAIRSLPLDQADAVVVAIGENVGASILTASILRNLGVKRIIARAINQIHRNILSQIGIEEVVLPLEDSAWHVASMLQLKDTLRLTELNEEYAVAETFVPGKYAGHTLDTINIGNRFNLKLIAVKIAPRDGIITSLFRKNFRIDTSFDPLRPIGEKDILVVAGKIVDIKRFVED